MCRPTLADIEAARQAVEKNRRRHLRKLLNLRFSQSESPSEADFQALTILNEAANLVWKENPSETLEELLRKLSKSGANGTTKNLRPLMQDPVGFELAYGQEWCNAW